MAGFDPLDVAIFAIAAFIAVFALVKLMRGRRDQLLSQLRGEMDREHQRKLEQERLAKRAAQAEGRKAS